MIPGHIVFLSADASACIKGVANMIVQCHAWFKGQVDTVQLQTRTQKILTRVYKKHILNPKVKINKKGASLLCLY